MGIFASVIATAKRKLQTIRFKKEAKGDDNKSTPTDAAKPSPLSPAQQEFEEGLYDEHLASTAPPTTTKEAVATDGNLVPDSASAARIERAATAGTAAAAVSTNTPASPPLPQQSTATGTMASDEDYAAFLDKANQDPSEGMSDKPQVKMAGNGKLEFKAMDSGAKVPPVLDQLQAYYISDADEEFVPVCLKFSGKGLPDESAFARLVNHPSPSSAEVSIMDIGEWDPQAQYKEVIDAVRQAGKGSDVRVYRIVKGGTRVEYWVVTIEGGHLVGVKALAIES
ncbi:hypothetical protein BP6252_03181 [Coleophoma cylindrospora]|uniref:Uncharacterized protein n=1 Tax=Coleophoma cylindrospora TaxID=1849047 RepID=A0A3D8S711_9HELO|nr:hypothetical protein BP6252_03181 [Coleophoma cylindrospora]